MADTDVVISGVGMHPFGRYPNKTIGEMGRIAAEQALSEAGLEWKHIPILYAGAMQAGSGWGHAIAAELGPRGIPIINIEAACASGIVGLYQACQLISAGVYDAVLAVGVEKQQKGFIPTLNLPMWQRIMGLGIYPAYYAMMAQRHMQKYGTTAVQLAKVSVKSHRNASLCPNAHYQQFGNLTVEDVLNSRMICDPITLYQIAPVSDGAAAAVVTTRKLAEKSRASKPIKIESIVVRSGHYDPLALVTSEGIEKLTADQAYREAGMGPEDLDVVECQDATTIAEIHTVEALGLCPEGEGGRLVDSGDTSIGGRIPVNTDGGYLSRGNATGAVGLAGLAEIVWQLRGQAGARQVEGAKVGLNETLGAGPTCSITILSR
jgi:acetyl-CoA C-acetyltransferase